MENFGGNHKSCRSVVSDLFWGGSKEFPLKLPGGRDYLFNISCITAQIVDGLGSFSYQCNILNIKLKFFIVHVSISSRFMLWCNH